MKHLNLEKLKSLVEKQTESYKYMILANRRIRKHKRIYYIMKMGV